MHKRMSCVCLVLANPTLQSGLFGGKILSCNFIPTCGLIKIPCELPLLYNMDSEPEPKRRYADLTMIIRPDMRHGKIFDVLIEFKFLSLKQLSLSGETIRSMSPAEL